MFERVSFKFIFSTRTRCVRWYHESGFLQLDLMAGLGDNCAGNSHAHDKDQGVEVLRVGLLTQEMALRALADNMDRTLRAYKGRLDEIADRLDALTIGANRDKNDDRR